jgi:hypothetical protein
VRSAGGESQKMPIFNQARCHPKLKSNRYLDWVSRRNPLPPSIQKSSQLKLDGSLRRSLWQMVQSLYFDWPNVYREEVQNRFVSKSLSPRTRCINLVLNLTSYDSCSALMRFTLLKSSEANENPRIISSNPTHLKQKSSHHRMRKVLQLEKKLVYSTNQQVLPCRNISWYR